MCITAPGRVIELGDAWATVDLDGRRRRASTLVVPDVAVGDWVIVGAGSILRRLEPAEGRDLAAAIGRAMTSTSPRPAGYPEGDPR
jgi:hydrogenase assembly chaperone HypC/HupF